MVSVSSSYLASVMNQSVSQAQTALANAEVEMTTGQYANLGLQLGGESGDEISLKDTIGSLQTYATDNTLVTGRLQAASSALDALRSGAQTALQGVAEWTPGNDASANLQTIGQTALEGLISNGNASSGDEYVFGGVNTGVAPLADYYASPSSAAQTAVDQAFQTQFGFLPTDPQAADVTSAQMQTFLDGPFAALFQGSQWTTNWSSASSVNMTNTIAPGQTIETSTNANTPAFQELAQAYTMMSEFGGSQLSQSALSVVANTASSLISSGSTGLTEAEASNGVAQQTITDADNSTSSQVTILQTQLGDMDNVDASQTATDITNLQTQIQTAYELTSRLQQLSLAQYLPSS